jgi:hypothetical protein
MNSINSIWIKKIESLIQTVKYDTLLRAQKGWKVL